MENNFWNNIARSTVRELAKAAGLRSSNEQAVEDLTNKYGPLPTAEFVDEMWLVLRDGWLTRSAPHREAVVARMRELGRGDMSLKVKTRSEQLTYLRTLRRSPALSEAVLKVFLESGSEERQPPVFVEPPTDAQKQQYLFFAMVRQHLLALDATTIESFERTIYDTIHGAVGGLTLPVADPKDEAGRILSAVATVFMIAETPEPAGAGPRPYQKVILDRLAGRLPDVAAAERLFELYEASLVPIITDPKATAEYVATWASAVFMATLAYDGPKDAPRGFANEIIEAQRRFVSDATARAASAQAVGERRGFDEALADAIGRIPNSIGPVSLDNGSLAWRIYMGSAEVEVFRAPFTDSGPPLIRFVSPLVREVRLSEDLSATLNLLNAREHLDKFYWRESSVFMEYEFVVAVVDELLLLWLLCRFAGVADHFDTMLRDRFGGVMTDDDQRAVFDA